MLNHPGSSLGFTLSPDTLKKLSENRKGALNPMYKKTKSKEFIESMQRSIRGENNPMYHKAKAIYVYNENHELINTFRSVRDTIKGLKANNVTISSYLDTGKLFRKQYYLYSFKREM